MKRVVDKIIPNMPPFILDIRVTRPSIRGPALKVPRTDATKDDKFVAPTPITEKLYGGAEKIWDRVREMPTSHAIQLVKRSTAQRTGGEAKR
ncbi:unnamed protein product [Aspergillus oryzae]|uniref:Unnamed protein product n=2 Tax=Aspergillus oryzae TaxID=5062 RepID=A0AAN5BT71_ASPOZ|nr:unnamed protein product [Aspergillus oryzae]GMF84940.1 unnamed protein product [Aspergillus oryzae]GMG09373.1 unnamed protein product [Aspergillus oryzae]GMG24556.1 unnamed protein product [Aspergillus oryzae]GMG45866.1 unnamed protein product [Aspergillus oryzae var. brunneus]